MTGTKELISLAFGASACLYKDVLQCQSNATASELRKAYHKRALRFHPDKSQDQEATLKFQAISAAYELLSDPTKRAIYDATGSLGEEEDEVKNSGSRKNKDRWTEFFRSVFQDILTADTQFDRKTYCGSDQERQDVLKFYKICKGDLFKIQTCILLSEKQDLSRWIKKILSPAINNGHVQEYDAFVQTSREILGETTKIRRGDTKPSAKKKKKIIPKKTRPVCMSDLEDTDDDEETAIGSPRKQRRKRPSQPARSSTSAGLVDTDDDGEEVHEVKQDHSSSRMSKRDKMEYRVAKKQREKKEREIQLAKLIKGKQWGSSATEIPIKKRSRPGTFSSGFLSNLEKKFADDNDPPSEIKKSTKRIKKRKIT